VSCRSKLRVAVRKVTQRKVDSPVDPTKRKGESTSADAQSLKKLKATPPESDLPEGEPEAHDAVPEQHEEAPASSDEGEDAEIAAQREKAAREGRAATKERRSKMREETPAEAPQAAKVTARPSSTPRVEPAQDLVLTQSPFAEVVDSMAKRTPVAPSGLGQFPLASAGFPDIYRQLGAACRVRLHLPKYARQ
jgi:hypothetical protein